MKAFKLKITIENSHPPIWRRCIIPEGLTFSDLTHVLNIVMGWDGYHLSSFEFDRLRVRIEDESDAFGYGNYEYLEASETLIAPFMESEKWFTYTYDFGDDWQHRVTIEEIIPDYEYDYPMVVKYKGDTPYEDCGGIFGYYDLLETLQNPEDPEYEDMRDWAGDPEDQRYDMDSVNMELKELHFSASQVTTIIEEEASLEEWQALYATATKIGEMKPWEDFYDLDLFSLEKDGKTAYASILGHNGECYGVSFYEENEGLNDFMMILNQKSLNLSEKYALFSQNNLTCYWGNRDELSKEQWNIVKSLGYKYRGKNQWLYFVSHKAGYYPENMNHDEVTRMTMYLTSLEEALNYYRDHRFSVDFGNANMFSFSYDDKKGKWAGKEMPLPFTSFCLPQLELTDDAPVEELASLPLASCCLEVSVEYSAVTFEDDLSDRTICAKLGVVADADSGLVLNMDLIHPQDQEGEALLNLLASIIFNIGKPKEVRVCNNIIKSYLEDFCTKGKIKLKRVKCLPAVMDILETIEKTGL